MRLSSDTMEGIERGAMVEDRPQDCYAASCEGDNRLDVPLPLASLSIVEGLGCRVLGGHRAEGGLEEDALEGLVAAIGASEGTAFPDSTQRQERCGGEAAEAIKDRRNDSHARITWRSEDCESSPTKRIRRVRPNDCSPKFRRGRRAPLPTPILKEDQLSWLKPRLPTPNRADAIGEIVTDATIDALNAALSDRGIEAERIISIIPVSRTGAGDREGTAVPGAVPGAMREAVTFTTTPVCARPGHRIITLRP